MIKRRSKWSPFHISRNRQAKQLQNHGGNVDYTNTLDSASTWQITVSWAEKENTVFSMIGPVWSRVIFESVYFLAANHANGTPVQIAKIND